MHVDQFTYGFVTPLLSYLLSVLGSLAGLVATARARTMSDSGKRARWLLLAALAIGGTGIWVMHFVAMLGFSLSGVPVRYDPVITFASWLLAVVVVAVGLFVVGFGRPNAFKIIAAGIVTGVGVAGMHYSGMDAMRTTATMSYDRNLVIASVAIAIVAATVALWFTVTLKRPVAIGVAALIMGVAVSGMHYTGMFAIRMSLAISTQPVTGLSPLTFMLPIAAFVVIVVAVLLGSLLSRPDAVERTPAFNLAAAAPASAPPVGGGLPGAALPGGVLPPSPTRGRTAASAFTRSPTSPTPPRSDQP